MEKSLGVRVPSLAFKQWKYSYTAAFEIYPFGLVSLISIKATSILTRAGFTIFDVAKRVEGDGFNFSASLKS